jgi:N-acetylglucosamine-6-phosphate deacetylase
MGAVALIRQVFADAAWQADCRTVWEEHPGGNEPPQQAVALDALTDVLRREQPVFIDATNEVRALRGARIAREFNFDAILLGSGTEFRRADELAATGHPILVPLAYPKKPKVESARAAEDVTLRTLLTWKHAPENARRIHDAGVVFAFTTHRLESRADFRKNLAEAIERGLPATVALDAVTRIPARLLGVDDVLGTIEPGRIGNLVLVEGDLLDPEDSIREVWIAGRLHEIDEEKTFEFPASGTIEIGELSRQVELKRSKNLFELSVIEEEPAEEGEDQEIEEEAEEKGDEAEQPKKPATKWRARSVSFTDDGIGGVIDGEAFGSEGPIRFSAMLLGDKLEGIGETASGETIRFTIRPAAPTPPEEEVVQEEGEEPREEPVELAALPTPLGAYGRLEPPKPETVLFRNARIWTATDDGILEGADLLISDGRIIELGSELEAPENARIIDATGKQITPGLIDCHSHTGIDGGVNEGSQNNTAEVRIGDVLDPDDINWYRQLAGGLTAANQLHGSANPIGGQNAIVKLRWGAPADGMHLEGAMPGIKFALGENVVRPENRYPDTRMGVAAFLEDAFRAASEYTAEHARFAALSEEESARTMPPRRDLELETLAEILASERLVHCHSYRQDEILMLLRTAERWGFTIGTLQHVLEGYKVAEAIAEHGAGASSFSDWWAYKMEVMDAVPHNGTLMTNAGVLASFNSDSDELARRMNTEAAKAVRYGGLDPHEALKMVTINPARQLRIDGQTGSLQVGKDADIAVWNGDPLSTFTRCEQTWIDGANYFDLEEDERLGAETRAQRAALLAELVSKEKKGESGTQPPDDRGGGQWRGRPGGRRPQSPVTTGRETLLARMLEAREAYLFEMVRSGRDPVEIRPGDCGCDEGSVALEILHQEVGR